MFNALLTTTLLTFSFNIYGEKMLDNNNNLDDLELKFNNNKQTTTHSNNDRDCSFDCSFECHYKKHQIELAYAELHAEEVAQHKELQLAIKVGTLLTESGAEIRRVESTMEHIIRTIEGNVPHCNCTPGSVQATVTYADGNSKTMLSRIGGRHTDFKKIIRLNELSRNYTKKTLTYEEALVELDIIKNMRIPPLYLRSLLNGLSCAGFTFLVSPTLENTLASLLIGFFAMMLYETIFRKFVLSGFIQTIIASAIIAVFTYALCDLGIGTSENYIIVGATTPLLPGVETINAVRDIVESDYLSAITRILNAVLIGTAIAVGVGFVYILMGNFGG